MSIVIATVNTTDKVGILDPRNAYHRRTPIGTAWLEVRMGMYWTIVPVGNDDTYCAAESITAAGPLDWFTFGIKDSSQVAPGKAGAQYMGYLFNGEASGVVAINPSNQSGSGIVTAITTKQKLGTVNGATVITAADPDNVQPQFPIWAAGNVNAFLGLKLTVQNPGASNQTITMQKGMVLGPATAVTDAALRTSIFNTTYGTNQVCNWFTGGAALPLSDYLWVRMPWNNNRLRITNIAAYKVS